MKKYRIKKMLVLMVAAPLLLSVSSCNTEAEDIKIRFVLDWVPNTNHTGIYVADKLGYYAQEGLEVEIIQPPEGGALSLVGAGQAEFCIDYQDYMAPALANENPLPVTAVAAVVQHNTSGIISLKEKGITSPKHMEGKTYSTLNNPMEQAIIENIVTNDGGDFTKVKMIPSVSTDLISALSTNIDCAWAYYGWDGVACEVKGLDTNFIRLSDINPVFDYYTPVIVANNNFLQEQPEVAKKFLLATKKGYEYAIENPDESAEILIEAAPNLDPEITKASQRWLSAEYKSDVEQWGYIDPTRWNGFYSWLYEEGLVEKDITNTGFSNEYLPE